MEQLIEIVEGNKQRTKDILSPPCKFVHFTQCTNVWETNQNCDINIQIVGDRITLTLPKVISAANSSNHIETLVALPESCRPIQDQYIPIHVTDNDVVSHGTLIVKTTGIIEIYDGLNSGVFSGTGNTGFESTSCTYVK